LPVRPSQRRALGIGNRDQRHVGERSIERNQVLQVEPPMERRCLSPAELPAERKMEVITMEMDQVELGCMLPHHFEHENMMSKRVERIGIEPQPARTNRNQSGCRL